MMVVGGDLLQLLSQHPVSGMTEYLLCCADGHSGQVQL